MSEETANSESKNEVELSQNSDGALPVIYPRREHCLSRNNIDPDALKIMYRLIRHGFKAYLVGGGVRDLLLNKQPKDFDIATDATPRKIKALFRNCRIIGRRFKLAHIYFRNNKIIEVSTFRDVTDIDESEDTGDDPDSPKLIRDNNYGTESTDATRRDLTINGLFYDLATFSIIDYVGGMQDLSNGITRVIGDPDERFQEDPVRMLRVVRHAARAGFSIESESWESIQRLHPLIAEASQVRVYEELKKDLCSTAGITILRLLAQSGLLTHLLPELLLNDAVLLREKSFFSQVLSRVGDSAANGEDFNITPVLAIIALFLSCYPETSEELHHYFEDREELSDHLSSCFVKFSVPRKERERIEDVLGLWYKLKTMDLDKVRKANLERRRCITDLYFTLYWLSQDPDNDEIVDAARKAMSRRSSGGRSKQKRSKRRSRGNRRNDNKSQDNKKRQVW